MHSPHPTPHPYPREHFPTTPPLHILQYPDLDASVAPPLICRCPMLFPSPKHYGDDIICDIIHDRIRTTAETHSLSKYAVVLVDHGSPQPAVARVRNYVADTLGPLVLASDAVAFAQCCMERRYGFLRRGGRADSAPSGHWAIPLSCRSLVAVPATTVPVVFCGEC